MEESFIAVLSSLGFPAAVSFYLLVKVTGSLDELTQAIIKLDARLEERHRGSFPPAAKGNGPF